MNSSRSCRTALRTARRSLSVPPTPVQRRFASGGHGSASQNESLGKGFYFLLFGLPSAIIIYRLASETTTKADGTTERTSPVTKLIEKYAELRDDLTRRNALHTQMVEKAADDSNLFQNTPRVRAYDLKFPENLFRAPAYKSVPAGSQPDLRFLIDHEREKAFAEEEEKLERIRQGKHPGKRWDKQPETDVQWK